MQRLEDTENVLIEFYGQEIKQFLDDPKAKASREFVKNLPIGGIMSLCDLTTELRKNFHTFFIINNLENKFSTIYEKYYKNPKDISDWEHSKLGFFSRIKYDYYTMRGNKKQLLDLYERDQSLLEPRIVENIKNLLFPNDDILSDLSQKELSEEYLQELHNKDQIYPLCQYFSSKKSDKALILTEYLLKKNGKSNIAIMTETHLIKTQNVRKLSNVQSTVELKEIFESNKDLLKTVSSLNKGLGMQWNIMKKLLKSQLSFSLQDQLILLNIYDSVGKNYKKQAESLILKKLKKEINLKRLLIEISKLDKNFNKDALDLSNNNYYLKSILNDPDLIQDFKTSEYIDININMKLLNIFIVKEAALILGDKKVSEEMDEILADTYANFYKILNDTLTYIKKTSNSDEENSISTNLLSSLLSSNINITRIIIKNAKKKKQLLFPLFNLHFKISMKYKMYFPIICDPVLNLLSAIKYEFNEKDISEYNELAEMIIQELLNFYEDEKYHIAMLQKFIEYFDKNFLCEILPENYRDLLKKLIASEEEIQEEEQTKLEEIDDLYEDSTFIDELEKAVNNVEITDNIKLVPVYAKDISNPVALAKFDMDNLRKSLTQEEFDRYNKQISSDSGLNIASEFGKDGIKRLNSNIQTLKITKSDRRLLGKTVKGDQGETIYDFTKSTKTDHKKMSKDKKVLEKNSFSRL